MNYEYYKRDVEICRGSKVRIVKNKCYRGYIGYVNNISKKTEIAEVLMDATMSGQLLNFHLSELELFLD